ncbi:SURF1 family protein [Demequina sp. SO4-13]|uniref:SURF1 family protein n=1 Tax=Demequina sp. SO4-13 TaxID=3401027 RepID=UPI003AF71954
MSSARRPSVLRIALTMAIALAVSAVAVLLGMWQYGRHVERADAVADFEASAHLDPVPVGEVVPADATMLAESAASPDGAALPDGAQWRMVTATGTFDAESLTVLRTRPVNSIPAWQYLAWLDTDDGQSFLVDLGWIRQPQSTEDPAVPALDADERVTVTAVLREWEPDDGKGAGDSITRITPEQLPEPAGDPIPGYGMLREICGDEGCAETPVGEPVPLPNLSVGPHLSYAWQWWLFAAMAPVGGVLLLRRDRQVAGAHPAVGEAAPGPPAHHDTGPDDTGHDETGQPEPARASAGRRRRRKAPSDEEIEDAL